LSALTGEVGLRSGAVRRIYDLQGKRVDSINDLCDEARYVAAGNEPFRGALYPMSNSMAKLNSTVKEDGPDGKPSLSIYTQSPRKPIRRWSSWHMKSPILIEEGQSALPGAHEKPLFQLSVCIFTYHSSF
jgi:hypothetical protein